MPELSALPLVNLHLVTVPDAAPPYDCPIHGARCSPRVAGRTVPDAVDRTAAGRPAVLAQPGAGDPAGADPAGADPAGADPAARTRQARTRQARTRQARTRQARGCGGWPW